MYGLVLSGTEWYGMVWYGMVSMHACMHQHMDRDVYIYIYTYIYIYMFSTRMVWTFQDSTPSSGFFPHPRWCLVQKQQCRVSLFKNKPLGWWDKQNVVELVIWLMVQKSCTSWYGNYPIICRVLFTSQVVIAGFLNHQPYHPYLSG